MLKGLLAPRPPLALFDLEFGLGAVVVFLTERWGTGCFLLPELKTAAESLDTGQGPPTEARAGGGGAARARGSTC